MKVGASKGSDTARHDELGVLSASPEVSRDRATRGLLCTPPQPQRCLGKNWKGNSNWFCLSLIDRRPCEVCVFPSTRRR